MARAAYVENNGRDKVGRADDQLPVVLCGRPGQKAARAVVLYGYGSGESALSEAVQSRDGFLFETGFVSRRVTFETVPLL